MAALFRTFRYARVAWLAWAGERVSFRGVSAALCLLAVMIAASPSSVAYESISGQEFPCGYGEWKSGEEHTFSHTISWSITIDWDRGYVVDCNTGTDAYMEYRGALPGDLYLYAVWGQLGDYH